MKKASRLRALSSNKSLTLLAIMVVVVVFFSLMNPGYISKSNIMILTKSLSLTGFIGIGVACLMIGGAIDLGTSSTAGLGGVLCGFALAAGLPWPFAILLTLIFGAIAGAINAFLVNKLNIMPFIATIGMSSVWQGVSYVSTRANPVKFGETAFNNLGTTTLFGGYIPLSYLIMVVLMILYGFILRKTKAGRSIYMCGGNRNAARLAGINPKKVTTLLFINCSMISAFGGMMFTANMRKGDPTPFTNGMDAITASILGGVSFMGGTGGMGGLFIGLMLLNTFSNGLTVIQLKSYWQIFAQGVLLIIALAVDYYRDQSRQKTLKAAKHLLRASGDAGK